ncbi:MAG: polysaccharide biosynthesis/export family protein, partial [Parafilimonas sp.]|nr:polysaccharide biosynthesis/export family protein [Parafilimonas sp.]
MQTNTVMLVQKLIPAIALIVLFSSCGVPKPFQKALYLQDSVTEAEKVVTPKIAVIEFGDRLSIGITAINKEAADAFNASAATSASGAQGYLVDSAGNIQLLQLGLIHAAGLTPAQLEANIEQQLADYIKGPVVSVSITNFKISVFGEVGNPGVINVPDGKITILQAIVQSGDVAMFGKRDNILVIREENGKR